MSGPDGVEALAGEVASWIGALPTAELRAQAIAARAAGRRRHAEAEAEAVAAREELDARRSADWWRMWCAQVSDRLTDHADVRADPEQPPGEHPAGFWLSRLTGEQFPERIAAWLAGEARTLVLYGSTGRGKEMPLDTPVLTPDGWVRNGDLTVGDEVIGRSGLPTRVTGVFDNGVKAAWRITFNDGTSIVTGTEHQWSVQTPKLRRGGKWRTVTTGEIAQRPVRLDRGRTHYRWFLPLVEPVEHSKVDLLVDPYVLGTLLANGTLRDDVTRGWARPPHFTTNDRYVVERVAAVYHVKDRTYATSTAGQWSLPVSLRRDLQELGCWGHLARTKRVPAVYLTAHVEARTELLRALMDCDGTVRPRKRASYSTSSSGLAEDVATLTRSLGGVAQVQVRNRADGDTEYVVAVWLPTNPFSTPRKAAQYHPKPWFRAVESITPVGEEEMRCISVAAEDRLYVTRDYLVTHNTHAAVAAGYAAAGAGGHVRFTSQLDYLQALRPGGCDDPAGFRRRHAEAGLLILDDLGAECEDASQFVRQEVCALLDARLRAGRRQVVTTNLEAPALAATFGDRIVSRLRDRAVVLKIRGGDRRALAAEPW